MLREGLENILLNLLYITLPFYLISLFNGVNLVQFIGETHDPNLKAQKQKAKLLLTLFGMAMIVLMMSFPIKVIPNHTFDMRQIPIILGFLYVGRRSGLMLFATMVVARFLIGGTGFYGAAVSNVFMLIGLFIIESHFKKGRVRAKIVVTVGLSLLTSLIMSILLFVFYHVPFQSVLLIGSMVAVLQSIGVFLAIYSIEKFKNHQFIREGILKAEKSQIVSDLAASVSHEVRNPMTVTKGFIQMTLKGDLSDSHRDYLVMALEELGQAEKIINDYLTFAKPALERPEPIDLRIEMEKVVQFLSPYANLNGLMFETHFQNRLVVLGETQKLHQCLSNLIKNSIEASPNGGKIIIETSQNDDDALISIIDHGTGMTEHDLRRIGEPYYSTKEKGTGLGMMVVYSIVKSMKGSIKINSQLGRGTEFHLKFPLVQTEEEVPRMEQAN